MALVWVIDWICKRLLVLGGCFGLDCVGIGFWAVAMI